MVILFVSPHYEQKGESPKGGVNMYMRRVTGALKDFGHTPMILTSGTKDMHYMENGIEIFYVHSAGSHFKADCLRTLANVFYSSLAVNRKISELIHTRNIDIIQFSSIQSWPILYFGRIPAVMRLSDYDKLYYTDYPNKTIASVYAFLQRLAAKRCAAVFAPSNVHANAFAKDIHRKVAVIESPFCNECCEYDDSIYRNRLSGKKYVLFFGRLSVTKGILVIAKILEQFLRLNPEYSFVCCGIEQKGYKENLARVLKISAGKHQERFIYMMALPHVSLYPIVEHADFVIFPSLSENFSNACMEAMHFEKVVIGTDGASFEQLIDDGKSGLLCMPGDSESLLDKMNQAAAMKEEQKAEMGRRAKERIDKLAPEYAVKELVRFYRYILSQV